MSAASYPVFGRRRFGQLSAAAVVSVVSASVATPARAEAPLPKDSLYQLAIDLTDQDASTATLASRRGRVRLITMFYTSCKFVCPLIISTLQRTEKALSAEERARLGVLLVSFDPARDTPQAMKRVAIERKVELPRWSLTRTDPASVRKLAGALGVQYRALEDGEVNHSSSLTLLDAEGRILAKTDKLGEVDPELVAALRRALSVKEK